MCGICGMTLPVEGAALDSMLGAIIHRGPDDGGTYVSEDRAVDLGSRRLSIIDLSAAGHMSMISLPPEARYVFYRSYYTDTDLRELYAPDMRVELAREVAGSEHLDYFAEMPGDDFPSRMLYVDWNTFLPGLNLAYSDTMSMAASVEVRVPFLDNEIVDFMLTVRPTLKLHGSTYKYVLRKAVNDIVPRPILERRKVGFGAPISTWLRRDLREMVDDLLGPERIKARGYFDPKAIRSLIVGDREGRADNTYRIWALLTLELWHQVFLDGGFAQWLG